MLGTEISSSPSEFFVGVGKDTAKGLAFGVGLTEYDRTRLVDGFDVGQSVAVNASGTPFAPITETESTVGAYAFLGFRPSIFRALLDRRKP